MAMGRTGLEGEEAPAFFAARFSAGENLPLRRKIRQGAA
jgi:hypothetical protein